MLVDPTFEVIAQNHWNDSFRNGVACIALLAVLRAASLWFLDTLGAIFISLYIIHSWYSTGKEQIEELRGKSAPHHFVEEMHDIAANFDGHMQVDVCWAYHLGSKFLVELKVVLPKDTLLFDSPNLGMELQYCIGSREEVG
jgi:divalent metal cation (Fe/Co/Zn/Cd) transporter